MSSLLIALLGPHVLLAACWCAGRITVGEATGNSIVAWSTATAQHALRAAAALTILAGIAASIRIETFITAAGVRDDWRGPAPVAALLVACAAHCYAEYMTERARRSGRTTVSIHPLIVRARVARVLLIQCGVLAMCSCLLLSSITVRPGP